MRRILRTACQAEDSDKPDRAISMTLASPRPAESYSYRSASIGSRREALNAGYIPKKMPTDAENPRPIANDHHGSEIGKPETRCTAQPMRAAEQRCRAGRRARSGTPPPSGTETGSRARRAPSALRTPISRVRSVTEIDMIAITPMPPTISAIDEMTTSAKNVPLSSPWRNEAWARDGSARSAKAMSRTKRLQQGRRDLSEDRMSDSFGFMVYQFAISVFYIFNHFFVQKFERRVCNC